MKYLLMIGFFLVSLTTFAKTHLPRTHSPKKISQSRSEASVTLKKKKPVLKKKLKKKIGKKKRAKKTISKNKKVGKIHSSDLKT